MDFRKGCGGVGILGFVLLHSVGMDREMGRGRLKSLDVEVEVEKFFFIYLS